MLSVDRLSAGYGSIKVLNDLSLDVKAGSIVALLGGNGAGKTTTMSALSGLIPVWSGEIRVAGEPIQHLPAQRIFARGLALVPQGRQLFPDMSVVENLELGGLSSKAVGEMKSLKDMVFEFFPRLRERKDHRAGSLSGGEQQMLAMGRALMSKPKLLLLDEPTTGLAPIIVKELAAIIKALNQDGLTVLIVEQNTRMALSIADHVYVIRHGAVVMSRSAAEISPDTDLFKEYIG